MSDDDSHDDSHDDSPARSDGDALHYVSLDEAAQIAMASGAGWAPGIAPSATQGEDDGARTLVVDGETFVVHTPGWRGSTGTSFDWVSGPNPEYGFSISRNDGHRFTEAECVDAARSFLAGIDPVTGYLA